MITGISTAQNSINILADKGDSVINPSQIEGNGLNLEAQQIDNLLQEISPVETIISQPSPQYTLPNQTEPKDLTSVDTIDLADQAPPTI